MNKVQETLVTDTPAGALRAVRSSDPENPGIFVAHVGHDGKEKASCLFEFEAASRQLKLKIWSTDNPDGDPVSDVPMSGAMPEAEHDGVRPKDFRPGGRAWQVPIMDDYRPTPDATAECAVRAFVTPVNVATADESSVVTTEGIRFRTCYRRDGAPRRYLSQAAPDGKPAYLLFMTETDAKRHVTVTVHAAMIKSALRDIDTGSRGAANLIDAAASALTGGKDLKQSPVYQELTKALAKTYAVGLDQAKPLGLPNPDATGTPEPLLVWTQDYAWVDMNGKSMADAEAVATHMRLCGFYAHLSSGMLVVSWDDRLQPQS